jgi:hypothetical protein
MNAVGVLKNICTLLTSLDARPEVILYNINTFVYAH